MTLLALKARGIKLPVTQAALLAASACATLVVLAFGITISQAVAIAVCLAIVTIWQYDRAWAVIVSLAFDITKPLLLRLTFAAENSMGTAPSFDLLGIAPSLLLTGLILFETGRKALAGEKIFPDGPRRFLLVFAVICFLSIFNPANSVIVGLGGFQRNVIPNMLILYLGASVFATWKDFEKLVKALLVIGLLSVIYGLGQYCLGIFPWEKAWFLKVAFKDDVAGWMTIGLRGIEFRIFSFFYSYAGFFYTNVLIFSFALVMGNELASPGWRKARIVYFALWGVTLLITLERMATIMTLVSLMAVIYLRSSAGKRKALVLASALVIGSIFGGLKFAGPYLADTGAAKLVRLAELANPFKAESIMVRKDLIWAPAVEIIKSKPLGVGIGFGSATKVTNEEKKWSMHAQPHNEVLQKTMETGVLGGVFYLILLASLLKSFLVIKNLGGRFYPLGIGACAVTAAFWLCGLVNLSFSGTPGLVYWTLAGVTLGLKDKHTSFNNMANQFDNLADRPIRGAVQIATTPKGN